MKGWLWKEGDGLFPEFKRRYFILEQCTLRYYAEEPSDTLLATAFAASRGTFDIRGSVIRLPKSSRANFPHC